MGPPFVDSWYVSFLFLSASCVFLRQSLLAPTEWTGIVFKHKRVPNNKYGDASNDKGRPCLTPNDYEPSSSFLRCSPPHDRLQLQVCLYFFLLSPSLSLSCVFHFMGPTNYPLLFLPSSNSSISFASQSTSSSLLTLSNSTSSFVMQSKATTNLHLKSPRWVESIHNPKKHRLAFSCCTKKKKVGRAVKI